MAALLQDERKRIRILRYQRAEATGHVVYARMAARERDPRNREVLDAISRDEKMHAAMWEKYTGEKARPERLRVLWYGLLAVILGYTFVIKRMERDEELTQAEYRDLLREIPDLEAVIAQEEEHENALHAMLDEERLRHVGSMVLGLNDALVEFTGTIAGLTFALADNRIVALAGIITGVSATLSMAASNYLAERADDNPEALKASIYTGVAYLVTVVLLVLPYLLLPSGMYVAALVAMLAVVILIILFFNYYIAVARSQPFLRRFGEMAGISLGVALIAFCIGLLAKHLLGVDI